MLDFLYNTVFGRILLKLLTCRSISILCGKFIDSPLSIFLIRPFCKKNNIDLNDYCANEYKCFNHCFYRKIREDLRPIDMDDKSLIAPCDGLLTVYHLKGEDVIPVKHSRYTLTRLLHNKKLAKQYEDGICLVFRLCVDNYHRYCYLDEGVKGPNHFIDGILHTVQPIALDKSPVFTENCREFTVMKTKNFGKVIQMEVGAMLVGKIHNLHERHSFKRGDEKGYFMYGGSTIIVLLKKDEALVRDDIEKASLEDKETPVKMGEKIGVSTFSELFGR